ncbi:MULTISPECIES: preprotein translocase subunit YajC [Nosocomiicoccus]|uniref:preprotein translocase subunit YajC n=1 Tax=Nosocomiicoccus TaxID=489909 RepID=UPI000426FDCB|nr:MULTISPECIES: preprotein translocase subunit YajC [Nosocomiicoccus]OFS64099.1 preprotein translocase subunit YajC [Nosocomiicoccus sp. HMSC09A07]
MDLLVTLLPFIAIFAVMYFLMIRPAQKRQKQINEMQAGLQKGDEVVTIGGLTGVVESFDANYMYLKVDEGTTLKFERRALHQVSK